MEELINAINMKEFGFRFKSNSSEIFKNYGSYVKENGEIFMKVSNFRVESDVLFCDITKCYDVHKKLSKKLNCKIYNAYNKDIFSLEYENDFVDFTKEEMMNISLFILMNVSPVNLSSELGRFILINSVMDSDSRNWNCFSNNHTNRYYCAIPSYVLIGCDKYNFQKVYDAFDEDVEEYFTR